MSKRRLLKRRRLLVLLLLLLVGCGVGFLLFNPKTGIFRPHIKQGMIEYKAEAVDNKEHSSLTVPDKMIVKFKNDSTEAELEVGFGFAKMKFISDPIGQKFYSQVLFFEKKMSIMDMAEVKKTNYYFPDYDVEYGGKSKTIAGYKCTDATLKFKDGSAPITVWYTKDISIKNPNWANAYYKIDGVLMDYRLKKYGLELHFTATTVSDATLDKTNFTVPEDYVKVPNSELEKLFKGYYE